MRHLIFILMLAFLLAGCATTKTPLPIDNIDEIRGTWINPEYDGYIGKVVWNDVGTFDAYTFWYDKNVRQQIETILTEKWMEPDGSIFIKFIWWPERGFWTRYVLLKLNSDRSFFEYTDHQKEFPPEIDPKHPKYHIYYRQK